MASVVLIFVLIDDVTVIVLFDVVGAVFSNLVVSGGNFVPSVLSTVVVSGEESITAGPAIKSSERHITFNRIMNDGNLKYKDTLNYHIVHMFYGKQNPIVKKNIYNNPSS